MNQRSCKKMGEKVLLTFGLAFLFCCFLATRRVAAAEVLRTELFNLEETSNMVVTLYYDTEEPTIAFFAPDGTEVPIASLVKESAEGMVSYYLPKAAVGQWYMDYDKGANVELELNYSPYANQISIEELVLVQPTYEGDDAALQFYVDGNTELLCNYEVFAIMLGADGEITGRKLLTQGTGVFQEEMTVLVPLSDLKTFDSYHLALSVWCDDYGIEVSDEEITEETIAIERYDLYDRVMDFDAIVNLTTRSLTLDWSQYAVYCDEYLLGVFDAASGKEIFTGSFDSDETKTKLLLPESCKAIKVELTYFYEEQRSDMLRKEIAIENGISFTFPEKNYGNESFLKITCKGLTQALTLHVKVNDWTEEVSLAADGSFSVAMQNFDNQVSITYSISDESTVYVEEYTMTVDAIAPILKLPEHARKVISKEEHFQIAGVTEAGSVVTVNEAQVLVAEDGTFLHEVTLADGENSFTVTSTDAAGNASMQTIVIERQKAATQSSKKQGFPYLPLLLAFVGSVIFLFTVIWLSASYQKRKQVSEKLAIWSLLRNVFLALTLYAGTALASAFTYLLVKKSKIRGEKLFDMAGESLEDALYHVLTVDKTEKLVIGLGIATGAFLVVFVVLLFVNRTMIKKQNGQSKAEKTDEN